MTAQTVWLPLSSTQVLQWPSRKKPVNGAVEQSSSGPPRTFTGASGFMSEIFRQAAEATTGVSDPVQALMWDLGWQQVRGRVSPLWKIAAEQFATLLRS